MGLVPRLLQPSPDADVLDDSELQDPVGTACPGRLKSQPKARSRTHRQVRPALSGRLK